MTIETDDDVMGRNSMIFKIEGDRLTISTGQTSVATETRDEGTEGKTIIKQGPRPKAFDSKMGALMVLKRMKK